MPIARSSQPRTRATLLAMLVPLALAALSACTPANVAPTFDVAQGDYARAFEASRETLREYRFKIDRVDAAAGVLTTAPKTTSGLATPWDIEQSTPSQEVEDLLAYNSRRVRITFEAKAANTPTSASEFSAGAVVGRVEAVIDRRYVRGWRVSPAAILQSDFTLDTQAASRGEASQFDAPLTRDERLAARISARIRQRLALEPDPQIGNAP